MSRDIALYESTWQQSKSPCVALLDHQKEEKQKPSFLSSSHPILLSLSRLQPKSLVQFSASHLTYFNMTANPLQPCCYAGKTYTPGYRYMLLKEEKSSTRIQSLMARLITPRNHLEIMSKRTLTSSSSLMWGGVWHNRRILSDYQYSARASSLTV